MRYALKGNIVLPNRVLSGAVIVENGIIQDVTGQVGDIRAEKIYDFGGEYIAPGFVDIHCHGSPFDMGHTHPQKAAMYHYQRGTTSMLFSLYRNLSFNDTLAAIDRVKAAMATAKNILGVHMEGPYLNPDLGSKAAKKVKIIKDEYEKIADCGIIKQWTFSPEIDGSVEFCKQIAARGIVPAIGHSAASLDEVEAAVSAGAKIVTHLMDATGASYSPSRYAGTKEVDFDSACMLQGGLYYEVINDYNGIHVRHDMIRLIIKTVGIDRVIGITDCFTGEGEGDINFENGELSGSLLTMDAVARNFLRLGLSLPEVFRITALTPAAALGLENKIGQIKAGNCANLLVFDKNLNNLRVFDEKGVI